jgi:hypothetical protein
VSLAKYINALKHANALRATQSFLSRRGLTSGVAWEFIAQNIETHLANKDLKDADLREFVTDVHSRARKLISVYDVSKKNHDALWKMAKESVDAADDDLGFPFIVSDTDLEDMDDKPQHVHTRKTTDGYEMFFTSARMGQSTEPLSIDAIDPKQRKNFVNATLYVERVERRQAFDVVFVPTESRLVQIRVDTGGLSAVARDNVRTHLETVVLSSTDISGTQFQALNLFRAIRSIYDDDDEGSVTGIQFNHGAGTHSQRMKRTATGHKDIRKDKFHQGGVSKIDKAKMMVYWLSVELENEELEVPEPLIVTLPGAVRNLNGQPLLAFEVTAFASEPAIAHAVGVIHKHVESA